VITDSKCLGGDRDLEHCRTSIAVVPRSSWRADALDASLPAVSGLAMTGSLSASSRRRRPRNWKIAIEAAELTPPARAARSCDTGRTATAVAVRTDGLPGGVARLERIGRRQCSAHFPRPGVACRLAAVLSQWRIPGQQCVTADVVQPRWLRRAR
jgi:hypothetical protein